MLAFRDRYYTNTIFLVFLYERRRGKKTSGRTPRGYLFFVNVIFFFLTFTFSKDNTSGKIYLFSYIVKRYTRIGDFFFYHCLKIIAIPVSRRAKILYHLSEPDSILKIRSTISNGYPKIRSIFSHKFGQLYTLEGFRYKFLIVLK